MKKLLGLTSVGVVGMVLLPLVSAFEAHVVNVTAQIENALEVPIKEIKFGTVFPQEALDQRFNLALSASFQADENFDDVEYVLRQKPKCMRTESADLGLPEFGQVKEDANSNFVCKDEVSYDLMPFLCPYLSKEEISTDGVNGGENDMTLPDDSPGHSGPLASFHGPAVLAPTDLNGWNTTTTQNFQLFGRLAKSEEDADDTWNVDLKVPCFGKHCAQDWAEFVDRNDGNNGADPSKYIQPIANEHKLFGCDLWLEVTGLSLVEAPKEPQILLQDGFGTSTSNSNDILNWEEEGLDSEAQTLARPPEGVSDNATSSPEGGRFALIDPGEWICAGVNAVGFNFLVLEYYWHGDNDAENNSDLGVVEYFTGGTCDTPTGTSTVASHELDNDPAGGEIWSPLQNIILPAPLDNTSFFIRFRNAATQAAEDFRIDGVKVTGIPN